MTFESGGLLIVPIYTWLPPASYVVFLTTLVYCLIVDCMPVMSCNFALILLFTQTFCKQDGFYVVLSIFCIFVPRALAKAGDIKTHSSVYPFVCLSQKL